MAEPLPQVTVGWNLKIPLNRIFGHEYDFMMTEVTVSLSDAPRIVDGQRETQEEAYERISDDVKKLFKRELDAKLKTARAVITRLREEADEERPRTGSREARR